MRVTVAGRWSDVPDAWDRLVGDDENPFLELAFLRALEASGCTGGDSGWEPRPVLVWDGDRLVAGAPAWFKHHSMGEFVYDHAWADLAARHRIPYYPKLLVGAPFSPVSGRRLLVAPDAPAGAVDALLQGLQDAARGAFGLHVVFNTDVEAALLAERGAFPRIQFQYWWKNEGYGSFDDFLDGFTAKARKNIRQERKKLGGLRIERVSSPSPEVLDHLFRFYLSTNEKYPWGNPYLNRDAFQRLGATWGHRLLAVLAWDGDRCVAGALDVVKGRRLYGRYWGADVEVPFLHFELCYYQGIDYAVANGLDVFEPGHGGEHKYRRGFLPEITWSNHRLAHPGLHDALARHTAQEADRVRQIAEAQIAEAPFRRRT